jgi:hypothetical protein
MVVELCDRLRRPLRLIFQARHGSGTTSGYTTVAGVSNILGRRAHCREARRTLRAAPSPRHRSPGVQHRSHLASHFNRTAAGQRPRRQDLLPLCGELRSAHAEEFIAEVGHQAQAPAERLDVPV